MAQDLQAKFDVDEFIPIQNLFGKNEDGWQGITDGFVKVAGVWEPFWPPVPDTGPIPPGVYLLSPTSQSLGNSLTCWALFDTAPYVASGHTISQVRCLVAWKDRPVTFTWYLADRPAHAASWARSRVPEYAGRSIYHNAAPGSIIAFDDGISNGFTLTKTAGIGWSTEISSIRCELTLT